MKHLPDLLTLQYRCPLFRLSVRSFFNSSVMSKFDIYVKVSILINYKTNCLFVLRFYGPVNPMGSCRARSVYLTTRLLGRLSPLSG